jgi:PII-like signaling protein
MIPTEARLLSIHVGANEQYNGTRLYEVIVQRARAMKLAGASVFPVEMSYGGHRQIHDVLSDYTFIELPVLIEIVDGPERVVAFLAALGPMVSPALVTIEPARVIRYSHGEVR